MVRILLDRLVMVLGCQVIDGCVKAAGAAAIAASAVALKNLLHTGD